MVSPLLVWIAFFSPLVSSIIIALFGLNSKRFSSSVAIGGLLLSFICTIITTLGLFSFHPAVEFQQSIPWIQFDGLTINIGFLVNHLSLMMLLIVTGVGSAIFIYSRGYMDEDPGMPRFFAYLSLFAFSMIGIVLANNLIELFISWELVGLSSYLLISFWYERPSAADAGVKAFLVNRFADFGFLCGIILLWDLSGMGASPKSFEFTHLMKVVPYLNHHSLEIIALLLFCGVIGKSAQLPLHVWLPDAMEGPTPVSALIHAATMVAAGVYLLSRLFFIFAPCSSTLTLIAYIGALTSLMAATIAIVENDIKRILAYSTLSQLGLMVMALGLGGPMQGMYHLTTHAFFKALLFLAAGSVIHMLHHEQNIWNMKGLLKQMPTTGITFLIGTLALCGVFPFSGFWSKDEIIALAYRHNHVLYVIASSISCLTAFYMGRLFWVAFWGKPYRQDLHESPAVMTTPLIVLAFFSALGGFMGIPHLIFPQIMQEPLSLKVALISSLMALIGLGGSYALYGKRPSVDPIEKNIKALYVVLKNKYYFDIAYDWYVRSLQQPVADVLAKWERALIDRLCLGGLKNTARGCGRLLRYVQTGLVQMYALVFILGAVALFWILKTISI